MDNQEIFNKIGRLETHIINLIVPLQQINEVFRNPRHLQDIKEVLSKPIAIDDRATRRYLDDFLKKLDDFTKFSKALQEITNNLDITKVFGEIKFMGKRLDQIEKILMDLSQNGLSQKVQLSISSNGYQMVEKVDYNENPVKFIDENEEALQEVLGILDHRERDIVCRRLGIKKEKGMKFTEIARRYNISSGRCSELFRRSLHDIRLYCKMNDKNHLIKLLPHEGLKNYLTHLY